MAETTSETQEQSVRTLGLTVLAEGGADPEIDIVFIHGLQGHPRRTWSYGSSPEPGGDGTPTRKPSRLGRFFGSRKSIDPGPREVVTAEKKFWPLDLLPKDFPRARIATFGYDSHVTHWFKGPSMQLDIFSYGESFLNSIEAFRRLDPNRPLIFIVHSLGGLVLKDALRRAKTSSEARFRSIYESVKAIVFFGTPHRGGSYVNLGSTVRKLAACGGFDTNANNLRDLKFDSSVAKMLREEFAKMLDERKPRVYTLQEGKGLTGFGPLSGKVVEDSSSALDYSLEQKDYIDANHMNMCRFSDAEDDGYLKVKDYLLLCTSDLGRDDEQEISTLRESILASLHIPETQDRFDQVEEAYEKTCDWIFNTKKVNFVKWLKSGSGIYWISGKPGSGKSTLMKFIASDPRTFQYLYENKPKHRLIWASFFFSNRGQPMQKSLLGLYHQILYQMLSQADFLTSLVEPIYEGHYLSQGSWTTNYLESALLNIVRFVETKVNICLFIDALDEHEQNYSTTHERLIHSLQTLIRNANKSVNIMLCLSSRPENLFQDSFASWPSVKIHEYTQFDVKTYVQGRFDSYIESRPDLSTNPDSVSTLSDTSASIIARAEGVFLWVKLITTDLLEALMDGENPTDVKMRLHSLPGNGDLQELYRLILTRLNTAYLREAYVMLQIVYATTQILPLSEFFEAVHYAQRKQADLDESEMERKLLSRCRGFLEIQSASWQDETSQFKKGKIVQFLHQSVREYLMAAGSFSTMRTQLNIPPDDHSQNGHVYLLGFRTSQHLCRYEDCPTQLASLPTFNLLHFEVFYQARMVERISAPLAFGPLDALASFADSNQLAATYVRVEGWNLPHSWKPTFLSLAVQAGLKAFVERTLRSRGHCSVAGRPLLHYAPFPLPSLLCGSSSSPFISDPAMLKLLVWLGANIDEAFEGNTAFTCAVEQFTKHGKVSSNQMQMLEALLDEGSNPNFPIPVPKSHLIGNNDVEAPFESTTALRVALSKADKSLVHLLLQRKASVSGISAGDWNNFEQNIRPMSLWWQYRSQKLNANELEMFRDFYSQEEKKQDPRRLANSHPSQLNMVVTIIPAGPKRSEQRVTNLFVIDHRLILESEPSARQYLNCYGDEVVQPGLPKSLRDCSLDTRSRVLAHWAKPPKPAHYF